MTRRDSNAGIKDVNQPDWARKSIRRIDRIGWAAFLREQIKDPYIVWTRFDPVEELAKWERDHPEEQEVPF